MKKIGDVTDRARRVNPIPSDAFEDLARSPEGQEILHAIVETPLKLQPARRSHRRAIGGLLAAAILASAGAVTAAVTMERPDSQQSAQVVEDFSSAATVHLDGWRPELDAEDVVCLFPETKDGLDTSASLFPLRKRLTSLELAHECTKDNDWASKLTQDGVGPFPVNTATLCIHVEGGYPEAVVGVGGIDCSTTPIRDFLFDEQGEVVLDEDDNPVYGSTQARPMTPEDLDELNRMRAIEVAVLAMPRRNDCPTSERATEWALARLEELGVSGFEVHPGGVHGCYRGFIDWNAGEVWIERAGNQP